MENTENLTLCQKKKFAKLLEKYPNIFNMESDEALSTADIGQCIESHPRNVIRDLSRISQRLGHSFSIQRMVPRERSPGFRPVTELDTVSKGGRQKLSSREKGFKGTPHYIRLVLVDR